MEIGWKVRVYLPISPAAMYLPPTQKKIQPNDLQRKAENIGMKRPILDINISKAKEQYHHITPLRCFKISTLSSIF